MGVDNINEAADVAMDVRPAAVARRIDSVTTYAVDDNADAVEVVKVVAGMVEFAS